MAINPNRVRVGIAALALSAAGFVGIVLHEGYTDRAVIPVPGDVPTIGFGTTEGVKLGDRTTPPQALQRTLQDMAKYEGSVKRCVRVPLTQGEYDAYISLAENIGSTAFCESTLVVKLNELDYAAGCQHIEDFVCGPATEATRAKPGQRCYSKTRPRREIAGLVRRRAAERALCLEGVR